jgi:hypothetical protein
VQVGDRTVKIKISSSSSSTGGQKGISTKRASVKQLRGPGDAPPPLRLFGSRRTTAEEKFLPHNRPAHIQPPVWEAAAAKVSDRLCL